MVALTWANLKMMARNRQAIFWALFFPLLLVVVFGVFDFKGVGAADVAVIDQSGGPGLNCCGSGWRRSDSWSWKTEILTRAERGTQVKPGTGWPTATWGT